MADLQERAAAKPDHDANATAPEVKGALGEEGAAVAPGADLASGAAAPPDPPQQAHAASRMDSAMRESALMRMQAQVGNRQVQRLVARQLAIQRSKAASAAASAKPVEPAPVRPAQPFPANLSAPQVSRGASPAVARFPFPMGGGAPGVGAAPAAPSSSALAPGGAKEYVEKHGKDIIQALYGYMSAMKLPLDVPFVSWRGLGNAGFNGRFCLEFFMKRDDPWAFIVSTTAGADPSYNVDFLIDQARDRATMPKQAMQWSNGVVLILANLYLRLLTASLARVVPGYVRVWNQRVLAEEKRLKTEARKEPMDLYKFQPATGTVRSGHPIDPYVISALSDSLSIDFAGYRKANPTEAVEHDIDDRTLRPVKLQIQPKQLNWVQVTEPDKATAAEVANELYGSETMAYLIIAAPPLFGFQMGPDEWPKLKEGYRRQISALYVGPFHPGTNAPMIAKPEDQLAGPLGEEAALNQAAGVKSKAPANREAVIERMRLIVGEFAWLKGLVKKWSLKASSNRRCRGPTCAPGQSLPTRARAQRRAGPPRRRPRWKCWVWWGRRS